MFYVFWIVDKDANPSTEVPRNGTTSSYIENVITVEVNNKNQIHRYGYLSLYFEQWTSRNVFQTFQKSNILDSNNKSSHGNNKTVENSSSLDNSIQTIKPHSKQPPFSEWKGSLYGHNASATNSHSKRKQGTKVGKSHKLLIFLLRVTKFGKIWVLIRDVFILYCHFVDWQIATRIYRGYRITCNNSHLPFNFGE